MSPVPRAAMGQKKVAFIAGLHRSGTSIVHRCLREHPNISGFSDTGVSQDEGQFLQDVFPPGAAFGGPGVFGFHPQARLDEHSKLITEKNRERLWHQWSCHWGLGRSLLLEKSPPNLIRSRFLQAMFPDACFVVLERHPVSVSLSTQRWNRVSLSWLFQHWLQCYGRFRVDQEFLERVMVLKYEDFATDPEHQLQIIYTFLGLEPVACRLEIHPDTNRKYFDQWLSMYRQKPQLRTLIEKFEGKFRSFGYTLEGLEGDGLATMS